MELVILLTSPVTPALPRRHGSLGPWVPPLGGARVWLFELTHHDPTTPSICLAQRHPAHPGGFDGRRMCRADDNSPNVTSSRRQPVSPDRPLAAVSSSLLQLPRRTWELASNNVFHSPLVNTSNLSRSFSFWINPFCGGRCNNMPYQQRRASTLCLGEHHNSWGAFLHGPFKRGWGDTLHH